MEALASLISLIISVALLVLFIVLCFDVKAIRKATEDAVGLQREALKQARKAAQKGGASGEFWQR